MSWLSDHLGLPTDVVTRLLATVGIFVALWIARRLWTAAVAKRTSDPRLRYRWSKASAYTVAVIGLILIGRLWLEGVQSLVTYFGLVSAGLAVALRDPVVNFFGWLYISWRRPFVVGDRIAIAGVAGDVVDTRPFMFTLLEIGGRAAGEQSSGRLVHVPNGRVFVEPITNYTQGFNYVWNEIPVTVTFESDWERAKEILLGILNREVGAVAEEAALPIRDASRKFLIQYATLTPTVYTRIVDHGVSLTLRYLCRPRQRRETEHRISEAILHAFAREPRIDFAYPTWRLYAHPAEGKLDLRPPQ
ncbi:mechanosensitive ion channel family protein [Candidatus Bipolaricaulota bacterium]|nr:mechanosensitive ion channel family protein [Candidatus Bipolaricaulota bacterium]